MGKGWMRKVLCVGMVVLLMLGPVSCRRYARTTRGKTENTAVQKEEELLIFTEISVDASLMKNFAAAYPDIAYREVSYRDMDSAIKQNGDPDIILSGCDFSLSDFCQEGYILDMTAMYDLDTEYDAQAYYPGAESVGKLDDRLYALPLGLETNYMTISDFEWEQMTFSMLPENYSTEQLLEAMTEELLTDRKESRAVFSGGYEEYLYDWLWDSGAIEIGANEVHLDAALFEQIAEMLELKTRNFITMQRENPEIEQWNDGLSPLGNKWAYSVICWGGSPKAEWNLGNTHTAPQSALVYAQSAQEGVLGEAIHVLWRPTKEGKEEYAAKVNACGMIGKYTKQPQKAYDVLRKMMDMPFVFWQQPDREIDSSFPVNRQQALTMLENVEQEGAVNFYVGAGDRTELVEKKSLSQELRTELEDYLTHIAYVYRSDREINRRVQQIWEEYIRENSMYNMQLLYEAVYKVLQEKLI